MLRFIDSFDHCATADLPQKYTTVTGSVSVTAAGRRSTSSLHGTNAGTMGVIRTIDAQAIWIVGLALNLTGLPASQSQLIQLRDASTLQVDLRINTDGTLAVTRNGTTLGTSVAVLSTGAFSYIEFKVAISDASGTYDVRVNGANVLSGTGDTKNTANASANQIYIFGTSGGACVWDIDDLYICDGTGNQNSDFLGDVRVDCYRPSGNGNSSGMTGSDGNSTDNYALVDETTPNGDTDYVESSVASTTDTYAVGDMTHTPTLIFGVQAVASAKKDDAGARSLANVVRSNSTDADGATQALSTSYAMYRDIWELDPIGSPNIAWTKTSFNAAEFGNKVAA